jgi:hypothetical protein
MDNSYEQQAIDLVKQNEALKAQVYSLRKCLTSESQGGIIKNMGFIKGRIEWYDKVKTVLAGTPEQCLDSVKASAVQAFANRYCGDCTTEYETKLNADANEWVYSMETTGES